MYLTTEQAGRMLGYSAASVRRMILAGDLPGIRVGDRHAWRIPRAAVEAVLGGRVVVAGDEGR